MAEAFLHGNGGTPLNVKVIRNPKPERAKENTIWVDTDVDITNWAFAATEHDAMGSVKNLITRPYANGDTLKRGVTFTVNDDGTITANGTNDGTSLSQFVIKSLILPAGTYYLTGCPDVSNAELMAHDGSISLGRGTNILFTLSNTKTINFYYQVLTGGSVTNAVCNPKLCKIDGMVWFLTGKSSGAKFNAIRKNGVMVYPQSCRQYVDGQWVSRTAKVYLSGSWKPFSLYLYDSGDECVDLTGGWDSSGNASGSITKNQTNMYVNITGVPAEETYKIRCTAKPIDLTNIATLTMIVSGYSCSGGGGEWCVGKTIPTSFASVTGYAVAMVNIANGTLKLDVSQLKGEYYVWFGGRMGGLDDYYVRYTVTEVFGQ